MKINTNKENKRSKTLPRILLILNQNEVVEKYRAAI